MKRTKIEDAFNHLWTGRYRLGLSIAEELFNSDPENIDVIICYAWALLENGFPNEAMEYANQAVEKKNDSLKARMYRGYLLMRLSIYEGALADLEYSKTKQNDFTTLTHLYTARSLAGQNKFSDALNEFQKIDFNNAHEVSNKIKNNEIYYLRSVELTKSTGLFNKPNYKELLQLADKSLVDKEFWFANHVAHLILNKKKNSKFEKAAKVLEIESLYSMFQYRPALEKAEEYKTDLTDDLRFQKIYKALVKSNSLSTGKSLTDKKKKVIVEKETFHNKNDFWNELNNYVGLTEIKERLKSFVSFIEFQKQREELGLKADGINNFNAMFMGNPGTGKTSIARLYAKFLKEYNIISVGHLIEVDRSDLVGQFIGETSQKTAEIIKNAKGGVLFIDEAYSLVKSGDKKDFGFEAIDIIVKSIEDDNDIVIVTAGYPDEMKEFINSNPGLKSRFNLQLNFPDYNPEELMQIFKTKISVQDYKINEEAESDLNKFFVSEFRKKDKSFGNARLIDTVFLELKSNLSLRLQNSSSNKDAQTLSTITVDDVNMLTAIKTISNYDIPVDEDLLELCKSDLQSLVGLGNVKEEIEKLINSLKVGKIKVEHGVKAIKNSNHYVFSGNPGTGKTSVARIISRIYKALGLIEKGHLVEVDRADLVAGYQGQTAIKTDKIIKKAIGGTLFIDEAYSLSKNNDEFGQEAIATLLKRMEDYKDDFIVIVAGYNNEMNDFLISNPGLKSRFTNHINFEDYSSRELVNIANIFAEENGYILDEGAQQALMDKFVEINENKKLEFGNAREAKNMLFQSITNQEQRLSEMDSHTQDDLSTIIYEDVIKIQ